MFTVRELWDWCAYVPAVILGYWFGGELWNELQKHVGLGIEFRFRCEGMFQVRETRACAYSVILGRAHIPRAAIPQHPRWSGTVQLCLSGHVFYYTPAPTRLTSSRAVYVYSKMRSRERTARSAAQHSSPSKKNSSQIHFSLQADVESRSRRSMLSKFSQNAVAICPRSPEGYHATLNVECANAVFLVSLIITRIVIHVATHMRRPHEVESWSPYPLVRA